MENTVKNKIKYGIAYGIDLILFPIICYFIFESIKFENIVYYFKFVFSMLGQAPQYILVPWMILISINCIIKSISKNNFISNIVLSVLLFCITLVSYYKYNALEQPFVPSDIFLLNNLNQITEFGFTGITFSIFISMSMLICLLIINCYINDKMHKKIKITIIVRVSIIIVGIIIICITCISPNRYIKFNIKNDNGDNYMWMGANSVFCMHLGDFYTKKPNGYNKDNINNIKEKYENTSQEEETQKPNIILIMNESFSDVTKLKKTTFSKNPMNIINEIKEENNSIYGEILTPVLGGGTSLPEFEVLTGLSSYFLEEQIYPYTSYIHENMNSIVRVFNKNNYTTVGIHTNTKTFYNRYNIYKYFGFQKTIFEEDIEKPEYKGNYISDNEAANQIIQAFENNPGEKFIFTVTMQNHMKYINKEYEKYEIEIFSDILTENEKKELKNYTQGVVDATKMYKKIMEYLRTQEEPTILIMFGDHLPLLGDSYCSTFKKNNLSIIEYYTTPYIIWANYSIEEKKLPKMLSTSNLGLQVLDLANIKNAPWYLKPFKDLYKEYPAINNKIIIDKDGKVINEDMIFNKELISECRVIQYDLLIKNKYIGIYN